MPATKRLVLDLPAETVDAIAANVASGLYANAQETVTAAIAQLQSAQSDPPLGVTPEEWAAFATRCKEVSARVAAGVEKTYSVEEARAELARRRGARSSV